MNIIYIILLTIFLTIIVYEGIKRLYKSIVNYFLTKEIFDDQWFVTENKIIALERRHIERFSKVESRLGIVEVLSNDFEKDMDRYHTNINKDINERMKVIRTRIAKLEDVRTFESSERVAAIEHRQKEYDTALLTQARMIGDLQNKQKEYKDRFKKVMDLKNIRVK